MVNLRENGCEIAQSYQIMFDILDLCLALNILPRHAMEIGVNEPTLCQLGGLIEANTCPKITLVEPLFQIAQKLVYHFENNKNVSVYNCAIADKSGMAKMFQRGQSTFLAGLRGVPAVVNDGYIPHEIDSFYINAISIDQVDDGQVDILAVDVEGAEYFVVKNLLSRPLVIILETHRFGTTYVNPFMEEIRGWMNDNYYFEVGMTLTDTVWLRVLELGFRSIPASLLVRAFRNRDIVTGNPNVDITRLSRDSDLQNLSELVTVSDDITIEAYREKVITLVITGIFLYVRIGFDKRLMTFHPNGTIHLGRAACEKNWKLQFVREGIFFEILSDQTLTCRLRITADGVWCGRWAIYEQMPVELRLC